VIIGPARIEVGVEARVRFPIRWDADVPDELWFEVDARHAEMLSDRADAALLGLVCAAMRAGEDVHVEGPVTDLQVARLVGEFQDLCTRVSPQWQQVAVTAAEPVASAGRAAGVGLTFSGGVDSFAAFARHHLDAPFASTRLTHLLYTNAGSHEPYGRELFHRRLARIAPIGERVDIPLVRIDSNISDFYWPGSWESTHVTRNVATVLALQAGLGRLRHAGSYEWPYVRIVPDGVQSRVEPILMPMLATDAFTPQTALGGLTRMAKTRIVADTALAHEFLSVCTAAGDGNCSRCVKCQMTVLSLELMGAADRFAGVFDLETCRRGREDFLGFLWASSGHLHGELREHLLVAGIAPPRRSLAGRAVAGARRVVGR